VRRDRLYADYHLAMVAGSGTPHVLVREVGIYAWM